jgi:hypothetical protein
VVRARPAADRGSAVVREDANSGSNGKTSSEAVAELTTSVEKCINCRFYDRRHARPLDGKAPLWGQCRRHAPHLNPVTAKAYVVEGIWPLVRDDDWCGEWKVVIREAEGSYPDAPALDAEESPPAPVQNRRPVAELGDD